MDNYVYGAYVHGTYLKVLSVYTPALCITNVQRNETKVGKRQRKLRINGWWEREKQKGTIFCKDKNMTVSNRYSIVRNRIEYTLVNSRFKDGFYGVKTYPE